MTFLLDRVGGMMRMMEEDNLLHVCFAWWTCLLLFTFSAEKPVRSESCARLALCPLTEQFVILQRLVVIVRALNTHSGVRMNRPTRLIHCRQTDSGEHVHNSSRTR